MAHSPGASGRRGVSNLLVRQAERLFLKGLVWPNAPRHNVGTMRPAKALQHFDQCPRQRDDLSLVRVATPIDTLPQNLRIEQAPSGASLYLPIHQLERHCRINARLFCISQGFDDPSRRPCAPACIEGLQRSQRVQRDG